MPVTTARDSRVGWTTAAILLAAYVPFFNALREVAATQPYAGHVVFVPIFAGVLLWAQRAQLRRCVDHSTSAGAAVTVVAVLLLAAAYLTSSLMLQTVSFVLAVIGFTLWRYGVDGLRAGAFVFAFLLLMVPIPREVTAWLVPALQRLAATSSAVVLELFTFPVEQNGIFLYLPGLTLEVAEECAGLRFLLIQFTFVAAFARLVLPSVSAQALLIALAVPVAVLANVARVAFTGVGAQLFGPQVIIGPNHYYIGKAFWALALLGMIVLAAVLRARTVGEATSDSPRADIVTAGAR